MAITVTLTSNLNPSNYLQPVTFTVTTSVSLAGVLVFYTGSQVFGTSTVPKPVFTAEGFTFAPLNLEVEIPDKAEYRGKGYMLLLRCEIMEQDIPAYAYAKIFVKTRK